MIKFLLTVLTTWRSKDNSYGPSEGKVVYFWCDISQGMRGCELKSNESTYNYELVSINDKVSAYSSYRLEEVR